MALSFADSDFTTPGAYREYLLQKVSAATGEFTENLVVLPGMTAVYLAYLFGELGDVPDFAEAIRLYLALPISWHNDLLALQQKVARDASVWMVAGTAFVRENNRLYHEATLLSSAGDIAGRQRQVFLSRKEKALGLSRGEDLHVFTAGDHKIGIIIGTDAWYPETGRILALKGADIICHCGALPAGENRWLQLAGMWQQVQQNQFFCVESQFSSMITNQEFTAESRILAPCEMTAGFTGVLAREQTAGETVQALLNSTDRRRVIDNYPLLKLLHPAAYRPLLTGSGGGLS
ncbi:MAG: carbon-nitrogen hydrolase family protein [Bacillota bacterium]|nr:carbon-nitrogen hydrolase family protein [Bacillota bacterium]MDW7685247.1 carbon-nitrogen hydrolase family protein [Bacillota bacterium]